MSKRFDLLIMVSAIAVSIFLSIHTVIDYDFLWHAAYGRYMVENHQLLIHDVFSYTAQGSEWYYPGWLPQLALYLTLDHFGFFGVTLLIIGVMSATFVAVWYTLDGHPITKAMILIFMAMLGMAFWSGRPQVFSKLTMAVFLLILERYYHKDEDHLWGLPVAMIAWTNFHGDYIFGVALPILYLGSMILDQLVAGFKSSMTLPEIITSVFNHRKIRKLALVTLILPLTWMVSPTGFNIYRYTFGFYNSQAVYMGKYVIEWQTPPLSDSVYYPFLLSFVGIFLLEVFRIKKNRQATALDMGLFLAPFLMVLQGARFIFYYTLTAPIVLSRYFAGIEINFPNFSTPESKKNAELTMLCVTCFSLAVATYAVLPYQYEKTYREENLYDIVYDAVDYVKANPIPNNVLNSYDNGSALIWYFPDQYKVFFDNRAGPYSQELVDDWFTVSKVAAGWEDVLTKYNIQSVWIEPAWPLNAALANQPDRWTKVYEDKLTVIYVKKNAHP